MPVTFLPYSMLPVRNDRTKSKMLLIQSTTKRGKDLHCQSTYQAVPHSGE